MTPDIKPSSHQVIHPQAHIECEAQAKIGGWPDGQAAGPTHILIDREHKGLWPHQERRVAHHQSTLNEGFLDHHKVKLGKVANPAVGELSGFTAGSASKIDFFNECDTIAACCCIQGYARSRDAAPNHQDIKVVLGQTLYISCSSSGRQRFHDSSPFSCADIDMFRCCTLLLLYDTQTGILQFACHHLEHGPPHSRFFRSLLSNLPPSRQNQRASRHVLWLWNTHNLQNRR